MATAQSQGPAAVEALVASGAKKDEGMALVLQILMMGECDALFGSYASNVAILVHDLQHARQVARAQRFHAVDVNGRCASRGCTTAPDPHHSPHHSGHRMLLFAAHRHPLHSSIATRCSPPCPTNLSSLRAARGPSCSRRVYCGCGASFCMKLEKRAGREPRRGIRHMIDAFKGDNKNAI